VMNSDGTDDVDDISQQHSSRVAGGAVRKD
jgi:hypothetical protein